MNPNKKKDTSRKTFSESLKQELLNYNKQDHIKLLNKKKISTILINYICIHFYNIVK